jgi:hypothetical protein
MYGYDTQPLNWKGWMSVLVCVAVVMPFTVPLTILPTWSEPERAGGDVAIWLVLMVVATLTFFRLCWVKTDGSWCWRWGQSQSQSG